MSPETFARRRRQLLHVAENDSCTSLEDDCQERERRREDLIGPPSVKSKPMPLLLSRQEQSRDRQCEPRQAASFAACSFQRLRDGSSCAPRSNTRVQDGRPAGWATTEAKHRLATRDPFPSDSPHLPFRSRCTIGRIIGSLRSYLSSFCHDSYASMHSRVLPNFIQTRMPDKHSVSIQCPEMSIALRLARVGLRPSDSTSQPCLRLTALIGM